MSRNATVYSLVALLVFSAGAALQAAEGWTTDYEAAKKQAAKEGKDILMDFTGSDWCIWCIRLKNEVFSKEAFKKEALKQFVLLELDYPRKTQLEPKLKAQNEKLRVEFAIQGYPTIMLTDATGKAYAKTGYQPGGPKKYLEHLAEKTNVRKERDRNFSAAEKTKDDAEKAKLLDLALSKIEETGGIPVLSNYSDIVEKIIKLDGENKGGLKSKYQARFALQKLDKKFEARDLAGVVKEADLILAGKGLDNGIKQKVSFKRGQALFLQKDIIGAIAALETARKYAPDSSMGKAIPKILEGLKKQAAKQNRETPGGAAEKKKKDE